MALAASFSVSPDSEWYFVLSRIRMARCRQAVIQRAGRTDLASRATVRRPVKSSLPARGMGAAATRAPALGTAGAAKEPQPMFDPLESAPEPRPLRPR